MQRQIARLLCQVIGILILISMVRNYRAAWLPLDYAFSHRAIPSSDVLWHFLEWFLCVIGGLGLLLRLWLGFWFVLAAFIVQCLGYPLLYLPFVKHLFSGTNPSPEAYYAVNLPLLLVLAILHYAGRGKPAKAPASGGA